MANTKEKLIEGAITTLRTHGIADVSARTIAKSAGVNQALVFYHFSSVNDLLSHACTVNTEGRVAMYQAQLDAVDSIAALMEVGRAIHHEEKKAGNVIVLAQVLAGAQQDPELATAARHALKIWVDALSEVTTRVTENSVLSGLIDVRALTETLAASFIGMELYDGIKTTSGDPFAALEPLAAVAGVIDDMNAVSKKAIRAGIRRAITTAEKRKSK